MSPPILFLLVGAAAATSGMENPSFFFRHWQPLNPLDLTYLGSFPSGSRIECLGKCLAQAGCFAATFNPEEDEACHLVDVESIDGAAPGSAVVHIDRSCKGELTNFMKETTSIKNGKNDAMNFQKESCWISLICWKNRLSFSSLWTD